MEMVTYFFLPDINQFIGGQLDLANRKQTFELLNMFTDAHLTFVKMFIVIQNISIYF